jgi:hypothetical protein
MFWRVSNIRSKVDRQGSKLPSSTDYVTWFGMEAAIYAITMGWIVVLLLGVVLILRVARIYEAGWKAFFVRVDVYSCDCVPSSNDRKREVFRSKRFTFEGSRASPEGVPWWRYPRDILFGRSLWKSILPCVGMILSWDGSSHDIDRGERQWITIPRGAIASLGILVLLPYMLFSVILEPCIEVNMFPVREYRGYGTEELETKNDQREYTKPVTAALVVCNLSPLGRYMRG